MQGTAWSSVCLILFFILTQTAQQNSEIGAVTKCYGLQAIRKVSLLGSQLEATIPCMNNTASTMYLNLQNVRKALHIKEGLPKWSVCR